jgi:cytochrome c-type biogenesis protein CcmH
MLWTVFVFLSAVAVMIVLWPLSRPVRQAVDADVEFYRAQVAAIDADLSRDLLVVAEAETARSMASRLLLQHKATEGDVLSDAAAAKTRRKWVAIISLVLIPAVAFGLYSRLGDAGRSSPAEVAQPADTADIDAAVAKIEAHLVKQPNDGAGFEVLAPIYVRLGRYDDAQKALANAIRLLGSSPDRQANLAEALIFAANGEVTPAARSALNAALQETPDHPKANYYLALAALQDGHPDQAKDIWTKLLAHAAPDAPWRAAVQSRLDALNAPAAPATDQPAADQTPMIRSMVASLADKLARDPNQLDGWLRLIRSYIVLNQRDDALSALAKARAQFASDPQALSRINDLAKAQGLGE